MIYFGYSVDLEKVTAFRIDRCHPPIFGIRVPKYTVVTLKLFQKYNNVPASNSRKNTDQKNADLL